VDVRRRFRIHRSIFRVGAGGTFTGTRGFDGAGPGGPVIIFRLRKGSLWDRMVRMLIFIGDGKN